MNEFHEYLLKNERRVHRGGIHREYRVGQAAAEARDVHHRVQLEEARKLAVEKDPMVQKAIDAMPKAKALLENAKKLLVQRTQQPSARR